MPCRLPHANPFLQPTGMHILASPTGPLVGPYPIAMPANGPNSHLRWALLSTVGPQADPDSQ